MPSKRARIALLGGSGPRTAVKVVGAFIEGMHALGYAETRDFEMDYRWAESRLDRQPALAEELVRRGADVIVAANPQAAMLASKFELVINTETARMLGLTVPPMLLAPRRRGDRMTSA